MYTILTKVGQGSQGCVYRGESKSLGQVAIKKIPIPHTQRERDRLDNEVNILSSFPSAIIPLSISLLDHYKEITCECLVTDFIDGQPLSILKGKNKEEYVRHIIRNILRFLSVCHSNRIAHRDIKPDNFIITKTNE
jgi:serine/threonine protein kinase